jgi:hypothetical protein
MDKGNCVSNPEGYASLSRRGMFVYFQLDPSGELGISPVKSEELTYGRQIMERGMARKLCVGEGRKLIISVQCLIPVQDQRRD